MSEGWGRLHFGMFEVREMWVMFCFREFFFCIGGCGEVEFGCDIWRKPDLGKGRKMGTMGAGLTCVWYARLGGRLVRSRVGTRWLVQAITLHGVRRIP